MFEGRDGGSNVGPDHRSALRSSREGAAQAPYGWYRLRNTQYDEIYLSPHIDDAAYSCGGQVLLRRAQRKRILIVTVFGSGSDDSDSPRGDIFRDSAQRKREEIAAMEQLDVDFLFLNLPDALHRKHSTSEIVRFCFPFLPLVAGEIHARLLAALQALFKRLLAPGGKLFFPLAVGSHPDHRMVCDVGRELHASGAYALSFYEDVAYVHVKGMLQDRLRSLGVKVRLPFFAFVRGVHRLVLDRAPPWQQRIGWPIGFAFLLLRFLLQRATGLADRRPEERDPSVWECDITSVVHAKVAAMRAYETQTDYFFPKGDALLGELVRSGERFVERYWTFPAPLRTRPLSAPSAHVEAELQKVDALLAELQHGAAVALTGPEMVASRRRGRVPDDLCTSRTGSPRSG